VQNPACRGSVEGLGNQALDPIIQLNLTKTEAFLKVYWYSSSTKICEKERTLWILTHAPPAATSFTLVLPATMSFSMPRISEKFSNVLNGTFSFLQ